MVEHCLDQTFETGFSFQFHFLVHFLEITISLIQASYISDWVTTGNKKEKTNNTEMKRKLQQNSRTKK